MSLQEAADARKAKLAALKKRKTLHDSAAPADGAHPHPDPSAERSAAPRTTVACYPCADSQNCRSHEVFKFRNYDPETGTARKHARTDDDDTVEKQVEGLAEKAILQDELQRAQELVSHSFVRTDRPWPSPTDLVLPSSSPLPSSALSSPRPNRTAPTSRT